MFDSTLNWFLFAQIDPGQQVGSGAGQAVGSRRAEVSVLIQGAWDSVWEKTISLSQTSVYTVLITVASTIAVFCLLFWSVNWVRSLLNDEGMRPMSEVIWVIIVLVLLRGPGDFNIAGLTTGMRALINNFNTEATYLMNATLQVDQKIEEVASYSSLRYQLAELRSRCNKEVSSQDLTNCLSTTKEKAQALITEYQKRDFIGSFADKVTTFFEDVWSDPGQAVKSTISSIGRAALSPVNMVIESVSLLIQGVFQYMIEMSMFVTALLGPIAVGATLLPTTGGGKPIVLWLTSFWSVGLCKLCLNVISGVASAAMYGAVEDPLLIGMTLGIAAPILALAMASGGGMAVFNALTQTAGTVVNFVVRVSK